MLRVHSAFPLATPIALATALLLGAGPGPVDDTLLHGLAWRNIGPFRGGRVSAVAGVIGEPGTFYFGAAAGGVWKTTSAGETWFPIFDSVTSVSAVGAIAVAPSNADVVYVGTGGQPVTGQWQLTEGDGIYRSVDAGKTWHHVGLEDSKRVPSILVDPRDANTVLVAALGPQFRKSATRGVFRSTDGGATWTRTLDVGDTTGVATLATAADRPQVVFATTTVFYVPPLPPSGVDTAKPPPPHAPTGGGIYRSDDGGLTWRALTGPTVPRMNGRTSVAVAMNTNGQRVYAITNDGLFRSDDGGTTWRQMDADDERIRNGQGGYNCGVYVDPANPDLVYTLNTSAYKSTDGGATFTGFRGAPGGDDPQTGWIDPTNGHRIVLGYDQGAIVTLDGGATWSLWYNQNTEQVYHISADNSFPYWVYATQQDAGAIRTRARGDLGEITPLDWSPVDGWEWGTIVPDPLDHHTVYASGIGLNRINMPTGQWVSVSPNVDPALHLRLSLSAPIVFAPRNPHELLAGYQYLMTTTNGGADWRLLSPDLTLPRGVRASPDTASPPRGGPRPPTIASIAPSPVAAGTIWVGTTNGLIKLTRDHGRTWTDVSIPNTAYPTRAIVETIDASPFDSTTAYAVVDLIAAGDYAPHLYRTRDFGAHWEPITNGLPTDEPSGSFVHVVRADPKRAGLLFAGTESGMFVSFTDGDSWQSLQLNLPRTPCRDIVFAGNDLLVGTFGRGIWVLDDYTVLRQMTNAVAHEAAHLFTPAPAIRVRRNVGYDTPFPLEVPHALNAPEGVSIDYWLASVPGGEITLDVFDSAGSPVRHLSSVSGPSVPEAAQPPESNFWLAPPFQLPANVGANRTHWDLRYDPPPTFVHTFEINANPGLTPASPIGALVAPGTYTVKLTVDGRTHTAKVAVTNDPRSAASTSDVRAQVALQRALAGAMRTTYTLYQQAAVMRARLDSLRPRDSASVSAKAIATFRARLDSVAGVAPTAATFAFGPARVRSDFVALHDRFEQQFSAQENGDLAPTTAMRRAFMDACRDLGNTLARWRDLERLDPQFVESVRDGGHDEVVLERPLPGGIVPRQLCGKP
jgi:photosystem II stability/assembly factor-like uncharacterized protein